MVLDKFSNLSKIKKINSPIYYKWKGLYNLALT